MYLCVFRDRYNYCRHGYNTPEALFLHIQIYHINLTNYTCGQIGCDRTFQRLDSFKRHVRKTHFYQLANFLPEICMRPPNVEQPLMNVNLLEEVPLPAENEPVNELPEIDDRLEKVTQKYLSTLYFDKSLSRTTIQRIIYRKYLRSIM